MPVHPIAKKMTVVPMRAAMVMPEMGFALTPISPVIRELTVTKKNPKTTIRAAPSRLTPTCGRNEMISATSSAPPTVTQIGRSLSVRSRVLTSPIEPRRSAKPCLNARAIVGRARISAMIPADATAPAPM
jgi:hypothetical protein